MTRRPPSQPAAVEVPLLGGTANRGRVHRVQETVRRPLRPTSPAIHALLRHLEEVGFDGAPRLLGVDERGREVLSFIPGEAVTAPAPGWGLTDAALHSVGQLLRRFHDAVAGFDPSPYTWPDSPYPPFDRGGITHNDPNLDNVVFRDGRAVALIDFDLASPGDPLWDVAGTARMWAPLRLPADTPDERRDRELHRFRVLADAYGVPPEQRTRLVDAVRSNHDWMYALVRDGAGRGVPGFAAYWSPQTVARAERARVWLERNTEALSAALR